MRKRKILRAGKRERERKDIFSVFWLFFFSALSILFVPAPLSERLEQAAIDFSTSPAIRLKQVYTLPLCLEIVSVRWRSISPPRAYKIPSWHNQNPFWLALSIYVKKKRTTQISGCKITKNKPHTIIKFSSIPFHINGHILEMFPLVTCFHPLSLYSISQLFIWIVTRQDFIHRLRGCLNCLDEWKI